MPADATVAARILRGLRAAGAETAFGLPGFHNHAFWRDVDERSPALLGVRHEQTTVYAADGLARATGGLGVALTTTGPGAANALGAFGEAAASKSPVLLVASEISTALARPGVCRGVLHECRDQAALFEPLAKAVHRPRDPEAAVAAVAEAVATALSPPCGPVYVDVPTDVLALAAPELEPIAPTAPPAPAPDALAALVAEVERAGEVVLWVGGGAVQSDAADAIDALARRLRAPVVTTYAARGILPPDHPALVPLPPHEPEIAALIAEADLLLAIGTDFDGMMTRNWTMPLPPRLAAVNCDATDLAKNWPPDVPVLADARATAEALAAALPERGEGDFARLRAAVAAARERLAGEPEAATPLAFLDQVAGALPAEAAVVLDMAIPAYWYGGYGEARRPRQIQYPVGWGTLGYALPASLGPAAAGLPTLAVCGDGGVAFALAEIATAVQHGLDLTLLVFDDGGYGMLRYDQDHAGDPHRGVDLPTPDWSLLARSLGARATTLDGVGPELGEALATALAGGGTELVVVEAAMTPPRTTSPRWGT